MRSDGDDVRGARFCFMQLRTWSRSVSILFLLSVNYLSRWMARGDLVRWILADPRALDHVDCSSQQIQQIWAWGAHCHLIVRHTGFIFCWLLFFFCFLFDWAFQPRDAICTPLFCVSSLFAPPLCIELNFNLFSAYSKSTYLANGLFKLFWLFWLC
jgi:hypothetical protein